jgi:hypothetical protein
MTFRSSDIEKCPMGYVFLYESKEKYDANEPINAEPTKLEDVKFDAKAEFAKGGGLVNYYFALTDDGTNKKTNGDKYRSNLGFAEIFICGKETIATNFFDMSEPPKRINRPIVGTPDSRIPQEEYSKFFVVEIPDGFKEEYKKCGVPSDGYKLLNDKD